MVINLDALESICGKTCLTIGGYCLGLAASELLDGNWPQAAANLAIVGAIFCLYRLQKSLLVALDRWLDRKTEEARRRRMGP